MSGLKKKKASLDVTVELLAQDLDIFFLSTFEQNHKLQKVVISRPLRSDSPA